MNQSALIIGDKEYTWTQIGIVVRGVENRFKDLGLKPGNTLLLTLENSLEYLASLLAGLTIGCRIAVLNPGTPKELLQNYVDYMGIKLIITSDKGQYPEGSTILLEEELKLLLQQFLTLDNGKVWTSDELFSQTLGGVLQLSSGSTGTSKIVFRTTSALLAEGISYRETLSINEDDIILGALPLYHSYPQGFCLFGWLLGRCQLVLKKRFLPGIVLKAIQQYKITLLPLIPVVARLMVEYSLVFTPLATLRHAMVGAGPTTKELESMFFKRFGVRLSGNYGSTETGALAVRFNSIGENDGFLGELMYGVKAEVHGFQYKTIDKSELGEIRIQTPAMMAGYLGKDGSLSKENDSLGWFPMGDFGSFINQKLHVQGRIKRLIDRGGIKINPAKIEFVLLNHPDICEAMVVGEDRQSITREQRIFVAVVPVTGSKLCERTVREYLKSHLTILELPDRIWITDEIPYLPNQKPDYQRLIRIVKGGGKF
ncbi:class I adenylate-forming enzyme family protein [Bacillus cereus]|uniref:class I adenylate-forming enzyme family protein n=1 Tax=Bacillus cereus TaxID=1396 RepID=UPI00065C18B2|nr:class I adenylate-forming enzyme family protein [Bacillus cereus]KMQ32170.1 hypothetical protein TU58_01400 [Bacillus cereus]